MDELRFIAAINHFDLFDEKGNKINESRFKSFKQYITESIKASVLDSIPKKGDSYAIIPQNVDNPLTYKEPGEKYSSPFSDNQFLITSSGSWIRTSSHQIALDEMWAKYSGTNSEELDAIENNPRQYQKFVRDGIEFSKQLNLVRIVTANDLVYVEGWHGNKPTAKQMEEIRYVAAINKMRIDIIESKINEDIPNCPNGGYLAGLTSNNYVVNSAETIPQKKHCATCKWRHLAKGYPKDYVDCHHPYFYMNKPNIIKQPENCYRWEPRDENV